MKTQDIKIALRVGSDFFKTKDISIKSVGHGSNNKNFLVKSKEQEIVIKLSFPHKEHQAYQNYIKEKWCIEKSSRKGVTGPSVLAVGESQGRAYMIETFVPGVNGKKIKNKLNIYYKLGKYTKLIHAIKTSGFGGRLINPKRGLFKDSWKKYLDYNIKSLTNDDKLIKLGILNTEQSKKIRKIFESIKKQKFNFGLNHGDISIWNTLVEKSGKVNLLDWGEAEAHIVPHYDFTYILGYNIYSDKTSDKELTEFIKGYGMSQKEFKIMKPELLKIMLLISFDKLRWAIDRNPKKIKEFSKKARRMIKFNNI